MCIQRTLVNNAIERVFATSHFDLFIHNVMSLWMTFFFILAYLVGNSRYFLKKRNFKQYGTVVVLIVWYFFLEFLTATVVTFSNMINFYIHKGVITNFYLND
jgi:hypothetical protein